MKTPNECSYLIKTKIEDFIDVVFYYFKKLNFSDANIKITLFFILFILYGTFLKLTYFNYDFIAFYGKQIESNPFVLLALLALVILGFDTVLSYLIKPRHLKILFNGFFSCLFIFFIMKNHYFFEISKTIFLFYLFFNFLHLMLSRIIMRQSLSIKISFFIGLEIIFFYLLILTDQSALVYSFNVLIIFRYCLIFTNLPPEKLSPFNPKTMIEVLSYVFTPTHLLSPVPINFKSWESMTEDSRLKIKSTLFLFFSIIFLILGLILKDYRYTINILNSPNLLKNWIFGAVNYFYFFCNAYVSITIPVCIAWWFGVNIQPAFALPFLATSPQDRWRTWNTLFYDWFFKFIHLPIFKKTKSLALSIFIIFLVNVIVHANVRVNLFATEDISEYFSFKNLIIFNFIQALLLYLGLRFSDYLPSGNKKSGWLGVVFMFILMSFAYSVLD